MNNRAIELDNAARDIASRIELEVVDWRHETKKKGCKQSDLACRNLLIERIQQIIKEGLDKWKII